MFARVAVLVLLSCCSFAREAQASSGFFDEYDNTIIMSMSMSMSMSYDSRPSKPSGISDATNGDSISGTVDEDGNGGDSGLVDRHNGQDDFGATGFETTGTGSDAPSLQPSGYPSQMPSAVSFGAQGDGKSDMPSIVAMGSSDFPSSQPSSESGGINGFRQDSKEEESKEQLATVGNLAVGSGVGLAFVALIFGTYFGVTKMSTSGGKTMSHAELDESTDGEDDDAVPSTNTSSPAVAPSMRGRAMSTPQQLVREFQAAQESNRAIENYGVTLAEYYDTGLSNTGN